MLPIKKSVWEKKSALLFANKSFVFSIISLFVLLFFVRERLTTISNFQEFLIGFFGFLASSWQILLFPLNMLKS
ncbi:hypothetical protein A946_02885 [Methylacidiphilum kamchatkense Kam1]|uniref:Uncharacterized protein n=1 Tax=Methylacidiphilum kamchatkense Kam1 TaxID=1202785 RepID=A0ABR4ZY06_9BACT|nr:hypothetical protein A946_02885 [Methylacidiphilum kamchatkense Kam1]